MGQRGTSYGWEGCVDDVRIYGRQLEDYEIEALVTAAPAAQATRESPATSGGISPALSGIIGLTDSGGADPSSPPSATPRTPRIDALLWGVRPSTPPGIRPVPVEGQTQDVEAPARTARLETALLDILALPDLSVIDLRT